MTMTTANLGTPITSTPQTSNTVVIDIIDVTDMANFSVRFHLSNEPNKPFFCQVAIPGGAIANIKNAIGAAMSAVLPGNPIVTIP